MVNLLPVAQRTNALTNGVVGDQPWRRSWRNAAETRSDAAAVAIAWTTTVGVVVPGVVAATVVVAAEKVVATPTTAAGVTAVAEAEARLGLVVARDAAKEAAPKEATGAVAAALGLSLIHI